MEGHTQNKDASIKEFLSQVTKDWSDQRLVQNEDGTPADFSPEAFDALLSIAAMPVFIYAAYIKAISVKEKN